MALPAAPLLVALATSALGTWDLGARTELRGYAGTRAGHEPVEADLYELQPLVHGTVEDGTGRLRLTVTYAPRLILPSRDGKFFNTSTVSSNHVGEATVSWRPDERWLLTLTGQGSSGFREVSPLTQAGGTPGGGTIPGQGPSGPGATDPSLSTGAGLRAARYTSAGANTSADTQVSARWRVGASANYFTGEGRGEEALTLFPSLRSWGGEGRATFQISTRDEVGVRAGGSRSDFVAGHAIDMALLALRWRRDFTARWTAYSSAGAGWSREHPGNGQPTRRAEVLPFVEAGVALAEPVPAAGDVSTSEQAAGATPGRGFDGRFVMRLAPYVDPFAQDTVLRVESLGGLGWRTGSGLGLSATLATSTATRRNHVGPTMLVTEFGVRWRQQAEVETGIVIRGSWQEEVPGENPYWQWGIAFQASWQGRRSF